MITMRLSEVAMVLGLPAPTVDAGFDAIACDSRKVRYGSMFAALPGTHVDGHEFASSAANLGATALLLTHPLDLKVPQLIVADVSLALGQIARYLRRQLDPEVVGITGSNGKTTVKEMVASILREKAEVLATCGNYNNELGVPLTLFRLDASHRYAVLEMGASKAGDIAYLASIAEPDIGVITNIGPAHLQGFGSLEGVAKAKGEMYAGLPENGWAILNGDEKWCPLWRRINRARQVLTFGESKNNDVNIEIGGARALMRTPQGEFAVQLNLPGTHNLINAAAAGAAALALGVSLDTIARGLAAVQPVPGRLNFIHVKSGWTVIDDTYNANPASLYSALQVLAGMQGTAWLVLGDMKELGEDSRKLHAEVGDAARALGVSRIFATGEMAEATVDTFGIGAQHFADHAALIAKLKSELRGGINCLVKGSRSMGMERVVEAITEPKAFKEAS